MNSSFNTSTNLHSVNVLAQNNQAKQVQDVAELSAARNILHAPPDSPNIRYSQSLPLQQQLGIKQHMVEMGATRSAPTIFDTHQMQQITGLEKTYYSGTGISVINKLTPGRYFTTSDTESNSTTAPPNTILIANNFKTEKQSLLQTQQQKEQHCGSISGNLRIVPAAATNPLHQHVFNVTNDISKDLVINELLHLQQLSATEEHIYQHHQDVLQHRSHFTTQQHILPLQSNHAPLHYTQLQFPQQQHALQQFDPPVSKADTGDSNNAKRLSTNCTTSSIASVPTASCTASTLATSSTVVLDRINICINNHYKDAATVASPIASSTSTTPPHQPSPIIPAIQHKPMIDSANTHIINPYGSNESNIVMDEPDSTTTTSHTPPTTPENAPTVMALIAVATTATQSPNILSIKNSYAGYHSVENTIDICQPTTCIENHSSYLAENFNYLQQQNSNRSVQTITQNMTGIQQDNQNKMFVFQSQAPLIPSKPSASIPVEATFAIGEDVLIKRADNRFYLGTVTESTRTQFLVRFDDKSEFWSTAHEMRKLGIENNNQKGQMCVACKLLENTDIVEICERCGRGYHRSCTDETTSGSGNWMCKRCLKPMKILKTSMCLDRTTRLCCQLPYNVESLKWDEKHRVNEERIYCYCGKIGKFDDNMLQCCRCKNWYHTDCIRCFKNKILRGDGFFVFCCSVCNNDREFLRRLQMNWVDLIHLTLYNLSASKKHQNQKYHHLVKDIWPFALENKINMATPKTWLEISDEEFREKIKRTLNANSERFVNGKEIKKDPLYYALRSNGPPILPKIDIGPDDVLSESLIVNSLQLKLLTEAPENAIVNHMQAIEYPISKLCTTKMESIRHKQGVNDVYEFRIEDDEKFTSDDEIPIKHIMEKAKKLKKTQTSNSNIYRHKPIKSNMVKKMDIDDCNDDSCNALIMHQRHTFYKQIYDHSMQKTLGKCVTAVQSGLKQMGIKLNETMQTSRKRKAFTFSKSYKEAVAEADAEARICDSSSDENSSSSRGTSLDLIIPPPKNFLGINNPFRMITPKKNTTSGGGDKKIVRFLHRATVKSNILTTTSLDFSSKLAALKSSGIFSNLSSKELAKAAGQPRLVHTIKRRLSAKDITIGPVQEVRRRRIRRLSSNIEVISQTTINAIPSNFIPIHAKDSNSTITAAENHKLSCFTNHHSSTASNNNNTISGTNSSASSSSVDFVTISAHSTAQTLKPGHGRRLRQRPEKYSPNTSRRSSISGASTSSNSSMLSAGATCTAIQDLKQSVTKYFGAVNRIESGEKFSIRAKRRLANGQMQYLIEWGANIMTIPQMTD